MAEYIGFTTEPTPEFTEDPYSIVSFDIGEDSFEYLRRYTTLNNPADIQNATINKLFVSDWLTVGNYEPTVTSGTEPILQVLKPKNASNNKRGLYVEDTVGIGVTTTEKIDETIQLLVDTTYNSEATLAIKSIGDVSIVGALLINGSDLSTTINELEQRISALETP